MEEYKLSAKRRSETGKGFARKYRRDGFVPGVLYGPEVTPFPVAVNGRELSAFFRVHGHTSFLIDMNLEGEDQPRKILIRELQRDPVTGEYKHIDFYQVSMTKKLNLSIRINLVGAPTGVKLGGILQHIIRELEVSCLPTDIPDTLEVDVSELEIGDSIHVSDITLDKVEILTNPARTIVTVVPPTVIKVPLTPEEEAAAEAEAEGEEGEEGEGEEGEGKEGEGKKEEGESKKEGGESKGKKEK